MKKILLLFAMLLAFAFSHAQENTFGHGYRGHAELDYTIGVGDYDFERFEISTTQGYQVNPYFFVGGGVGFHFMQKYGTKGMDIALDKRDSKVSIPVFADFRGTFSKRKFAPLVDLKLGYFVTNNDGFYGNISAGCRMAVKGKQAISLSIGYTYEKLEFETFDRFTSSTSMNYIRDPRKLDCEGISNKLGYEF
ncbi:MAG TPA: hypothetical protein DD424_09260 [Porphyromonadaceae bacterium]|nr:hypothetical protein [Porphyromonadaceae bacterium]